MTFLRRVLCLDAATCVATGAMLSLGSDALASMLGLPAVLLLYAGLSLFPTAAFMLWVATRATIPVAGAWLVIVGNVAWVVGSLLLFIPLSPTALGVAFVLVQAAAVAVLAELEYVGLQRMQTASTLLPSASMRNAA